MKSSPNDICFLQHRSVVFLRQGWENSAFLCAFSRMRKTIPLRQNMASPCTRTTRPSPSRRCRRRPPPASFPALWMSFWMMTWWTKWSLVTESRWWGPTVAFLGRREATPQAPSGKGSVMKCLECCWQLPCLIVFFLLFGIFWRVVTDRWSTLPAWEMGVPFSYEIERVILSYMKSGSYWWYDYSLMAYLGVSHVFPPFSHTHSVWSSVGPQEINSWDVAPSAYLDHGWRENQLLNSKQLFSFFFSICCSRLLAWKTLRLEIENIRLFFFLIKVY